MGHEIGNFFGSLIFMIMRKGNGIGIMICSRKSKYNSKNKRLELGKESSAFHYRAILYTLKYYLTGVN